MKRILMLLIAVICLSSLQIESVFAESVKRSEISNVVIEIDKANKDFAISFDVSVDSYSGTLKSGLLINCSGGQYKVYKTHSISELCKEQIRMSDSTMAFDENKQYVLIPFIEIENELTEGPKVVVSPLSTYASINNLKSEGYEGGAFISYDIDQGINEADGCGYLLFDEENGFLGSVYRSIKNLSDLNYVAFETADRFGELKQGIYYIRPYATTGKSLVSYGEYQKVNIEGSIFNKNNCDAGSLSKSYEKSSYLLSQISGSYLITDPMRSFLPDFSVRKAWEHPFNPYDFGQCTWFCYGILTQLGVSVNTHGNGGNWVNNSDMPGWHKSSTPAAGSIASALPTSNHPYGTVAFVIDVIDEENMIILHGNSNGNLIEDPWESAITDWCIQNVSTDHYTFRDGNESRWVYLNPTEPLPENSRSFSNSKEISLESTEFMRNNITIHEGIERYE